jgi:prepilin-type N-terminal cleavage/methylation domain-containing protein
MKPKNTQNKATTRQEGQRGFTLVETSIASFVMLVGALAVSTLFLFSTQNNIGGGERALAMAVAQQQMEQIRSMAFEDSTLDTGTRTTTVRTGGRNYAVRTVVADETNSDGTAKRLKRVTIRVTPQTGGPSWMDTPVELVSLRSTLALGSFVVNQ